MKKISDRIYNRFYNIQVKPIRLVLFNIIVSVGIVGGFISMIVTVATDVATQQLLSILGAVMVMCICFFLANWKNQANVAATLLVGGITLVLFPVMFFTGGGAYCGMGYWFVMGILGSFLILEGHMFVLMLIAQILVILGCYVTHFFHPELIIAMKSRTAIFMDILQSLFILGFGLGIIIRIQTKVYMQAFDMIQMQNRQLQESEAKAEQANKAKSDFLSNMSHEIRSPLNAIIGMNELILKDSRDARVSNYAMMAQNSSQTLLNLLNEVLDFSKIEAGKIELIKDEYDLKSLLNDCYQLTIHQAEAKGLSFDIEVDSKLPTRLYGDANRIKQIYINLLSNAVKYTQEGFIVMKVSAKNAQKGFIRLVVEVEDSGIGMTQENIDNLFVKFERFDMSRNRDIQGTGLGMSISQELADLMNGSIEVDSIYGMGSTFTVTIPQIVVDETPIGSIDFQKSNQIVENITKDRTKQLHLKNVRILVVDDMDVNLMVMDNMLKDTGAMVDTALSGAECLSKCRETDYDLIFMDQMMPIMDGTQTMAKLRAKDKRYGQEIPVVMLTANALSEMKDKALREGFTDYVTKPIAGDTLERILFDWIPEDKISTKNESDSSTLEYASNSGSFSMDDILAKLPEIDLESALTFSGGSREFLSQIIVKYFSSERIENLKQAFVQRDWPQYQIEAHSAKSSFKTFGLTELSKQAKDLEFAVKEDNIPFILANHRSFVAEMERIRDLIL